MSPFDTSKMISFWVPLQNVPLPEDGGTGLLFVDGSHSDFALPFWNGAEGNEYDRLENRYGDEAVRHHMPLEVGSVTVHNGWTLHCADSAEFYNEDGGGDRYALSITYVDARAEVREDVVSSHTTTDKSRKKDGDDAAAAKGDNEDVWSFRSWVGEVQPRTQFRNAQVPIVWPINEREFE
jgi:ectoine hydroxylase-related dioxygenase (phytanoyl-CoA dioxygenase family)